MKSRNGVLIGLAAALAMSFIYGYALVGQERGQERPLRHDAAATVRLVAVRVLGPDGRPFHGLRKEDFTLYEDGQAKTITEFEVHAMIETGMMITPAPPSGEAAGRAAGAAARKLFFFLDQQASDQAGKDKAKVAALHFLGTQVRPGDQVAVLGWYAMSGFYIREYLTADLDRIRRAINGVTEAPPSPGEAVGMLSDEADEGLPASLPTRNVAADVATKSAAISAVPSGGGGGTVAPGTAASQRLDFIPRLAEIAEIFKTIPGSKNLILFTARNMGSEAEKLGRLFGAAGTAVFAVNTQDWKMGPFGTKFKYIWNDHSLKDLSAASGGKYFADVNDAAGISREVQDLTGNYYVLGYYVKDSWEGKYHKIRVEVKRPEARVLVQDGFADSKPFDRLSDFEKDIQLLDLLWSDEPSLSSAPLALEPLVISAAKTTEGCFLTKWDVGTKTGPPAAPVQIFALLRDPTSTALVSRKWDVDLTTYDGRTVWAYLTNSLGTGPHDMRLVIRDGKTGISFVGRARFAVAAPAEEGITLSSPLLFEDGPGASFLRLPTGRLDTKKGKPSAGPSILSLYHLIPKEGVPVVGEVSQGMKHLLAVIPFEIRSRLAEDTPILSVEAKLVSRSDGRETPLEAEIREHMTYEGSPDILAVDLILTDIIPGSYDLVITVEDMGTDRRSTVRKSLIVRS
jgi:VWFA-related protein